ncbi:hypothetical protein [Nocardia sp. NPDC052566]|uniref:hypothetical protein n=1 Tax=Nocardia sp. NPDC052566 TaxID=3364330 RepID=UPI0037C9264E
MSAPIDDFDLDVRLGEALRQDINELLRGNRGRSDEPAPCRTDDCTAWPICTTENDGC